MKTDSVVRDAQHGHAQQHAVADDCCIQLTHPQTMLASDALTWMSDFNRHQRTLTAARSLSSSQASEGNGGNGCSEW